MQKVLYKIREPAVELEYLGTEEVTIKHKYTKSDYLEEFEETLNNIVYKCKDKDGNIIEIPQEHKMFLSFQKEDGTYPPTIYDILSKIKPSFRG